MNSLQKLTHFWLKFLFYTLRKHQAIFGFRVFSAGIKWEFCPEMSFACLNLPAKICSWSQIRVIHSRQVKRSRFFTLQRDKLLDIKSRYVGSFFLEARSLVCFKKDMYTSYMHGIEEIYQDNLEEKNILNKSNLFSEFHGNMERSRRVSLTIRHFPKILNVRLKLGRKWCYISKYFLQ